MPHKIVASPAGDLTSDDSTKRHKLRDARHRATAKAAELYNSQIDVDPTGSEDDPFYELDNSPAFDPTKFWGKKRFSIGRAASKAWSILHASGAMIINPKRSLKSRVTKTTAGKIAKRGPRISRKADLKFLEAHDNLEAVEFSRCDSDNEDARHRKDVQMADAAEQVHRLQNRREAMRVAWITRRHVMRVKAVSKKKRNYPGDFYFEKPDDCGATEFMWGKWLGWHMLNASRPFTAQYIDEFDTLPFDVDRLRRHVERLITVSAPLQQWMSSVRYVYRWEDKALTGAWMATYFFFFYISHLMTFIYFYIIYTVVHNYYHDSTKDEIRASIQRTFDQGSNALKIGELMDKHGSKEWLGPLMEELGPHIQLQIGDLADLLEVLYNFYHWKSPQKTCATLFLLSSCWLICLLSSAEFCLKVIYFILGIIFFGCWPISSLHPQYRFLVSPIRWGFWDIPTHAEYSFEYLQDHSRKAINKIETTKQDSTHIDMQTSTSQPADATPDILIEDNGSDSDASFSSAASVLEETSVSEILRFYCTYQHQPGRLVLTPTGFHWRSSLMRNTDRSSAFYHAYTELDEMSKQEMSTNMMKPLAKLTGTEDKLLLKIRVPRRQTDDSKGVSNEQMTTIVLENMLNRDKAFNAIIGFSGLRWQNIQG